MLEAAPAKRRTTASTRGSCKAQSHALQATYQLEIRRPGQRHGLIQVAAAVTRSRCGSQVTVEREAASAGTHTLRPRALSEPMERPDHGTGTRKLPG